MASRISYVCYVLCIKFLHSQRILSSVLKTTGSAFENFIRDEYTTLVEVHDRIFSTSVDLTYDFAPINILAPTDEKKLEFVIPVRKDDNSAGYAGNVWDDELPTRARTATLETFALDNSASVQVRNFSLIRLLLNLDSTRLHCTRWRNASWLRTLLSNPYHILSRINTTFLSI